MYWRRTRDSESSRPHQPPLPSITQTCWHNVVLTALLYVVQMSAMDAGLKSLDTGISSQCAAAVDNLAGFYFKATHPEPPAPSQPSAAAQVCLVCLLDMPLGISIS